VRAPSQPKDRGIDGHDLWEIEIAFYVKYLRMVGGNYSIAKIRGCKNYATH